MKARVQLIIESEPGQLIVEEVASITRTSLSMESLGLSLAEGKKLLQTLQASVVNQQIAEWLREEKDCPICGSRRSLKGHHSLVCRTAFGKRSKLTAHGYATVLVKPLRIAVSAH